MALEIGKAYFIKNVATGKYLNVYGNDTISDGRNVTLYSKSNTNSQKWVVRIYGGGAHVLSMINQAYGLNIYTTDSNCTMFPTAGNDPDCVVDFLTINASQNLYNIKMIAHNKFLRATGAADLANVNWSTTSDTYAQWILELVSGSASSDILSKDTAVPTTTASTPYIISGIPDKLQSGGIDNNVEFHPGCGFTNGTNFNSSTSGTAVRSALQTYVKKVFGSSASLTDAQTCYYLYGERIANGSGQQFHPGVDMSYYDGAPIYAIAGGSVVYKGGNYGTVSIKVPSQNNVVMNYVHVKNIPTDLSGTIAAGKLIGYQGAVGTTDSHLHFEVRESTKTGPAASTYQPTSSLTTIKPYGYMKD